MEDGENIMMSKKRVNPVLKNRWLLFGVYRRECFLSVSLKIVTLRNFCILL